MLQTSPIIVLHDNFKTAIDQAVITMTAARLQVLRSFDLQVAKAVHIHCGCPHHGTEQCDCQLVMLLVYGHGETPVTLVVHGHDGHTRFAIVDTHSENPSPSLVREIIGSILSLSAVDRGTAGIGLEDERHAG